MKRIISVVMLGVGLNAFAGWTTVTFGGKSCLTDGNWKFVYSVVENQDVKISSLCAGDGDLDLSDIENDTGLRVVEVGNMYWLDSALETASGVSSGYAREHIKTFTGNVGLKTLAKQAFYKVTALTDVVLPNSLETIGTEAFKGCTALARVENFLPTSLTSLAADAFSGCTALAVKKLVWPSGFPDLPDARFQGWTSLEEVEFREGLVSIGTNAFNLCTGLKRFTNPFPSTLERIGDSAFGFFNSEGALTGCADFSRCALLREIPSECFWNCKSLEEVILPPCLTNINSRAFYNLNACTNIGVVAVSGAQLKFMRTADGYIGPYAFQGCKAVRKITIPWGGKTYFAAGDTHGSFATTPALEEIQFYGQAPDAGCPDFLKSAGISWTTRLVVSKKIDQTGWRALSNGVDYSREGCFGACTKSENGIYMYWGESPLEGQSGFTIIYR